MNKIKVPAIELLQKNTSKELSGLTQIVINTLKDFKMTNNKTELQKALNRMKKALSVYGEFKDAEIVFKAAKAYADLPEKIEGMKSNMKYGVRLVSLNETLDDILKLIKEG